MSFYVKLMSLEEKEVFLFDPIFLYDCLYVSQETETGLHRRGGREVFLLMSVFSVEEIVSPNLRGTDLMSFITLIPPVSSGYGI